MRQTPHSKKLKRKHPRLETSLEVLKSVIKKFPEGNSGRNFKLITDEKGIKFIKVYIGSSPLRENFLELYICILNRNARSYLLRYFLKVIKKTMI